MRPVFLILLLLLTFTRSASGNAPDTLILTRDECEARFLKENLLLIAEKLQVPKAEAMVRQARLWPNPNFTLDQVNLWATAGQTGGQEAVPPLFGNFGRNQQFGMEIEQLILTARKRSKLVAMEQVSADKASRYFDELLRNLRIEFRKNLTSLQYFQFTEKIHQQQLASVSRLLESYRRQVEQGHIPRSEWIRLKALELEILHSISEIGKEKNEIQKELKLWMRLDPFLHLQVADDGFLREVSSLPPVAEITDRAAQNRPDLAVATLGQTYFLRQAEYEKARRIPDLTLKGTYDRNGNTMLNFFGFGASIDLPLFNRNQGNIKYAQLEARQAGILLEHKTAEIENEVVLAYRNFLNAAELASHIDGDYENTLDRLLEAHTRNFAERNISLLEFLDFINAYQENKKIILDARKSVNDRIEELNYSIGQDLFP